MPAVCDLTKMKNVYFAGIGGISMSSLALILKSKGIAVSGYDFKESETTKMLESKGISVNYTYETAAFPEADSVIYTAALGQDDPILVEARKRKLDIFTRAELLGAITSDYKHSVGVAGTHGKSSTTGFLAEICLAAKNDSTILAGAVMPSVGSTFTIGSGDCAVFEACEYKNSYHSMIPSIKVILNCEHDHVDFFPEIEDVIASFGKFINDARYEGSKNISVINKDCPNCIKAVRDTSSEVYFYSVKNDADFYAFDIDMTDGFGKFSIMLNDGKSIENIKLAIPGMHNVSNSVAAAAAAYLSGIDPDNIKRGLEAFTGVSRRFERLGEFNGAVLIDDYAHHPDEIEVTLKAARALNSGRIICVFQPHTYSRTYDMLDEFARTLSLADKVYLCDIFPARETNTTGVSSYDIARRMENAECPGNFEDIANILKNELRVGDYCITMGAGEAYRVANILLNK